MVAERSTTSLYSAATWGVWGRLHAEVVQPKTAGTSRWDVLPPTAVTAPPASTAHCMPVATTYMSPDTQPGLEEAKAPPNCGLHHHFQLPGAGL